MRLILLLFSFLLVNCVCGQSLENVNWQFGSEVGVFHGTGGMELTESAASVINGVKPACISSSDGDLLLYTDGAVVYNGDHVAIENGSFSNLGLSNLFVPVPGNPDQYYLFRSAEWGVDYSVVDITLDGGSGAVLSDQKEVFFHSYRSHLMLAGKENSVNYWLIIADNQGGSGGQIHIRTWEVTSGALEANDVFSQNYVWATFFDQLDDAKLSPDCSKIATHHKGHYIAVFEFDNELGVVTNALPTAVDSNTSFTQQTTLEFSPSGQYLYVIGDFFKIDRFNLEVFSTAAIDASQTEVAFTQFNTPSWRDIKLGPYGDLYVLNNSTQTLDKVLDPDVESGITGVEPGTIDIQTESYLLPNTPNLSCSPLSFPLLSAEQFCIGDTTWISYDFSIEADEWNWDFGSVNGVFGSSEQNPTWAIYDETGTYEVTLDIFYFDIWHSYTFEITISEQPLVQLGDDVILCEGESAVFSVNNQETYDILWSDGSQEPEITVSEAGLYSVLVDNQGCFATDSVQVEVIPQINLNLNDIVFCNDTVTVDLDASETAAESYLWNTGSSDPVLTVNESGVYWVTASNSCFSVSDTAEVLLISFPEPLLPEDISLCEGETATISSAFTLGDINWNTGVSGPEITVGTSGTYTVDIDYAGCRASDFITVDVTPALFVNLDDAVLCESESIVLDATDANATNYSWSNGSSSPEITVSTEGTFWVELTNSCFSVSDTAQITQVIFPDPLLPASILACEGDTVTLNPAFSQGVFEWSNGENTQFTNVFESGTYNVSIEYLGCTAFAETDVQFQEYYSVNELEVPNVFTPNGDLQNRVFRPFAPDAPWLELCDAPWLNATVTIYNRWGVELFRDICSWDGNNPGGMMMHEGTYFYLVELQATCYNRNESRQIAGHVSLLR